MPDDTFDPTLTYGPRDAFGHALAVAGTLGGHAAAYGAVRALIGATEGSRWGHDPWGAGILVYLAAAIGFGLAAPSIGCWLALRAGRRPAAGLTGMLVAPGIVAVTLAAGQLLRPSVGADGSGRPVSLIVSLVTYTVLPPLLARLVARRIAGSWESRRPAWATDYPGHGR